MEELERLRRWLDGHRELWLDLLRVYFGFALFAKGVSFAMEGTTLFDSVQAANINFGSGLIAHYVIVAHICGGLFLGIGLLTRLAAVVQIPILAGAVFLVHRKEGLFTPQMTLELTILVLVLLVFYTAAGAGRLSVDAWLRSRTPAAASKTA